MPLENRKEEKTMKRFANKILFVALSVTLAMLLTVVAGAAQLKDIEKHWAKEYIEYGVEKGYISGYADGTFLPDKTVTRAEFSKMINNAVKLTATGTAKADFTDVAAKDWFVEEVKKAENAGYIVGDNGKFRPNDPVTRQEAAVILSRIVLPVEERKDVSTFADGDTIDSWASDSVAMIAAKGYIKGDENGKFLPKGALTRSQAAKLICEFVKNENVVNKDKSVDAAKTEIVFSETLFTDNIVIDYANEDAVVTVTFKNCRVLGTVYVKQGGVSLELENSSVKVLSVDDEGVYVSADKKSTVKTAYVYNPATLTGNVFAKVVLAGDELSAGDVKLSGTFADVEVSDDATVSADVVTKMTVSAKSNLVLQSGTIKTLDVSDKAKNSTINLAKKAVVENANNKAVVKYIGSGTIKTANNEVTGVVYDGVTVEKTAGKVAEGAGAGVTSGKFFDDVEVTPANKKSSVAISSNMTITFLKEVFDKNGEKLTASYVQDYFKFTKTSEKGTETAFTATISSNNKKLTIKPKENLKNSTSYYLVIPAGTLTYEDGSTNEEFVTYFKTIAAANDEENSSSSSDSSSDDDSADVTFSPKSGATDVALDTSIKLTFSGTLKAYSSSDTLDEEYIEDEAIVLYEGSTSGDEVRFSATISGKTITLKPSRLLGDTKYYVVILGNKLKVGGSALAKTTMSFTTEEGTPITISPEHGATGVSTLPEIVVSFTEPMLKINGDKLTEEYIQDNVLAIKKGSTKDSADDVYYSVSSIAENGRSFTLIPDEELESATTYYIILEEGSLFGETSEEENAKVTSSFKTASAMAPMFYPTNGKENVALGTELKISFSDELLVYATKKEDRVPVDDEYLDTLINGYEDKNGKIVANSKNRISLKRVGASKPLTITATLDSDGKTIIITTDEALLEEKSYTLSIDKNLFYSLNGSTYKANTSGSSTFSTNIAMSPVITPKNDAENVAVSVNPTIKFSEDIFNADGKELKSLYVKNNAIEFVDQYGEDVEFTVEITGSTITIVPEENLDGNVEYTLTLLAGTITNEDGLANAEKSVTFTTKISYTLEVTPASSKTNISPFVNPVVKFGTEVFTVKDKDLGVSEGEEVDEEYASKYIFLTQGSKSTDSDNAVPATIEIGADGRTFTIVPDDELDFNTKYYINVVEKMFLYADEETKNKGSATYFTTIKEPALTKCTAATNNSTSIKITYTSNVADSSNDKLAQLVVEDESGNVVKTAAITSTSSSSVTVTKLDKGTTYTFYVYIVYDGRIESEVKEVTAKTSGTANANETPIA